MFVLLFFFKGKKHFWREEDAMLFYYLCHLDHFLNSFFGNILVLTQTSDLAASYVWSGNVRYVYMQATIYSALKETDRIPTLRYQKSEVGLNPMQTETS